MKIKETIDRDCCHPVNDLIPYRGRPFLNFTAENLKRQRISFCKHCGQLWIWTRAPGEMDRGWEICLPGGDA